MLDLYYLIREINSFSFLENLMPSEVLSVQRVFHGLYQILFLRIKDPGICSSDQNNLDSKVNCSKKDQHDQNKWKTLFRGN